MPPKKKATKAAAKLSSGARIDPARHTEKLKEIEDRIKREEEIAAEEVDEEEYLSEEGEEEAETEEDYYSDPEQYADVGRIDLSFPETTAEFEGNPQCYLPSYYTLSAKERCLLLYAENFRHQFVIKNKKRRPLILAPFNECNVQKFVCTTIRPTAFLHLPLIGDAEAIASFVADFIIYEPLENMMLPPTHIISPDTLLRRRRGHCFDMATLLCSMLIGAGFPAFVVSGVARAEVLVNDQRKNPYPFPIEEAKPEDEKKPKVQTGQKYKLRPLPDLESHLEESIAEMIRQKEEEEQRVRDEEERLLLEELELNPVDRYHYKRCHAWVAITDNAPWSLKGCKKYINEEGDIVEEPLSVRFIEPSTGFFCMTHCMQYILIDSVWNNSNYYVNRQQYQRVGDIRWDLRDTSDWEHLLPGEPPEMRAHGVDSDENLAQSEPPIDEEKHLDTIRSWVRKLYIGHQELEERFPNLEKTVQYQRVIHQRFSPYTQRDGKVMQVTTFADDECTEPLIRWEHFQNRIDLLEKTKYTYSTKQMEETFGKGRNESLKFMDYNAESDSALKRLYFYSEPRVDSLQYLEVHRDKIIVEYNDRSDRCFFLSFEFRPAGQKLRRIVEKFKRNPSVPASKDIAVRTFFINQLKIFLKFHYVRGALTSSTREFLKPPKPDYGQELIFDPSLTTAYKANIDDEDPTPLELYRLLQEQLEHEDRIKKQFEKLWDEIMSIIDQRKQEMQYPILKFNIFDPLRNGAARAIQMKKSEEEAEAERLKLMKPADFLAPYLVLYKDRALTIDESWAAYNACLQDMQTRFVNLLNELQRQYEDLTTESKALKRFLNKFENQFNNYDYDKLVQQAKDIELNKRMVQQRLTLTHEESQKKYEFVKQSLLNDERLNLQQEKK